MWMRTNIPRLDENPIPVEERGTDKETELAIAKKYQVRRAHIVQNKRLLPPIPKLNM